MIKVKFDQKVGIKVKKNEEMHGRKKQKRM